MPNNHHRSHGASNHILTKQEDFHNRLPRFEAVVTTTEKGTKLRSKGRQTLSLWLLLFITFAFVLATLLYTFFSSSAKHPITIFTHPDHTILILIIGSTISTTLLGKLFLDSSELLRWSLASRPEGVGLATFLALGSSTGTSGVVRLLFSQQNGVGHRKWCAISLINRLFQLALVVVLLSNPSFETAYKQVGPTNQIIAGLGPFNTSIPKVAEETQGLFTYYTHSFLANQQIAAMVDPPITARDHFSYVIQGPLWKVGIMESGVVARTPLDLSERERDDANAYLVIGAPGYQMDFSPIETEVGFTRQIDCRVYDNTMQLCVKNTDNGDLIAGWTACSEVNNECLSTSSQWSTNLTTHLTLRLSSLKTQTTYDLMNATIQDVLPLTSPVPVVYSASNILKVFDLAFGVSPGQNISALLTTIFCTINANSLKGRKADLEAQLLRNILALPLYLYNYGTMGSKITDATQEMNVTGHVVETKYRITVAEWSLYTFLTLSEIILFYSLFVLVYALLLAGVMPNRSDYGDWDVLAKCVGKNRELRELMRGTGNDTGGLIRERMRGYRVFVGSVKDEGGESKVVLRVRNTTGNPGVEPLKEGTGYG